jgi:hypothetical protein
MAIVYTLPLSISRPECWHSSAESANKRFRPSSGPRPSVVPIGMGCETSDSESKPSIECHADLRAFFHDTLTRVLTTRRIAAPPFTEAYLVTMLAALGASVAPHASLTELRIEAESGPASQRLDKLRALGDLALSRIGLFEAKLGRIGVSKSFVADVGVQAYRTASQLASASSRSNDRARAVVFYDLGEHFERYTDVLEEVRESTSLAGSDDLLALYERYTRTGSSSVLAKLTARGILCVSDTPPAAES